MELQLLFTGLGVGSIYALVALGFVLIFRATNVVNFAQGDFAMLGGFAMVVCAVDLNLPYGLSIAIALAAVMAFGALFNLLVYYPLLAWGLDRAKSGAINPYLVWVANAIVVLWGWRRLPMRHGPCPRHND